MRSWPLALLLLATACGGSAAPVTQPTVTHTVTVTHTPIPAPTLLGKPVVFRTADGNLGCDLEPAYAQCDIAHGAWKAPKKPGDCFYTWGKQVEFSIGSRGAFYCGHPDSNLRTTRVLPVGQALQVGLVTCRATGGGIECSGQGNGFFLSRARYRLF